MPEITFFRTFSLSLSLSLIVSSNGWIQTLNLRMMRQVSNRYTAPADAWLNVKLKYVQVLLTKALLANFLCDLKLGIIYLPSSIYSFKFD